MFILPAEPNCEPNYEPDYSYDDVMDVAWKLIALGC